MKGLLRWASTVRVRLTALYGGLFLAASTALLVTIDLLLQGILDHKVLVAITSPKSASKIPVRTFQKPLTGPQLADLIGKDLGLSAREKALLTQPLMEKAAPRGTFEGDVRYATSVHTTADLRNAVLHYQWTVTFVAVAVLTVVAVAAGWWLAGRVLRPLHRITETAQKLSLSTLHERIDLKGPADELKELADTFDAMLERLERAVESQRRFVANASHELRTPLAIQRAAIEIGLEDASPERVAEMRKELLAANLRTERLIEGLLVLAQGERGLDRREPVALFAVAQEAVRQHLEMAEAAEVTVRLTGEDATVAGDPVLLTRLVGNLVHNAIRYNRPGGWVDVWVGAEAAVEVANSGPVVLEERLEEMFEPFRRFDEAPRTGAPEGAGLGLSIVAAIAQAHHSAVVAKARPEGGLVVSVPFRAVAPLATA